jgi:ribosome-associated protein
MPDAIYIEKDIVIPAEALEMRAVRSSGPGGQNVNKVASKVELRVELSRIEGMDAASLRRLTSLAGKRLDSSGRLLVTSQKTRDQARNLEDARQKILKLVARALKPPKRRRDTQPTAAARERRLREKKLHSRLKAARKPVGETE